MASTESTPSDMHGLTASQLSELQGAVQALDNYLLVCVDDLRNKRWDRPNAKVVADRLVRELARSVGHRFHVKPIADTITLHHRTKLLTRRVRAAMRAFNNNHNYFSETPNITWDDAFIPPKLYADLKTELESLYTREGQQGQKEKEGKSQSLKTEEQMAEEKANTTQNDKGKEKETAHDKENPDETENPKRKLTRKPSESSLFDITSDNEDSTSSDESEPLAKRAMCMESIDNVGLIPIPPPCRRCTISQMECKPNGWHAACKNCRKARQTCSLSKALPNDTENTMETAENDKKPDDTEKPKTQIREIHTSVYTLTKSSILDDRFLIEDEDTVDQLDEVPANKPSPKKRKISTMMMDGLIPNDPKCERCEEFHKECFRRETQDPSAKCMQCDKSKKGCKYLTKGQSKINFIPNNPKCDNCNLSHKECLRKETQDPSTACRQCAKDKKGCSLSRGLSKFIPNDPICERCERSHKECVRKDTQDRAGSSRCRQCVKDHQMCSLLKSQSNTKIKSPPPMASKSMEQSSSSSSNSHEFDLKLMQQQLKAAQEDLRIAQQQLQLANSRNEDLRKLYEAELAGYRGRVVGTSSGR